ncbi:hypothetical protein BGZ98_006673, partial [Dissophora globulifera]
MREVTQNNCWNVLDDSPMHQKFLTLLAQKPRHDVDDLLVFIIYLIAQDRILEAKEQLSHLSSLVAQGHLENDDRKGTSNNFQQIQYDYL